MEPARVRPRGPKRGRDARELGVISGAALACKNGKVIAAGRAEEVEAEVAVDDSNVLDAGGRVVAPGFVDAHTHLVFAGWRAAEYGMRSEGRSYLEIAAAGGGILSTVRATREASFEELCSRALGFLDQMLLCGTTSCEAKSGYGLDLETELKQLRVARYCDERHPVDVVSTFLGAHAIPRTAHRETYISQVIEMLPVVKGQELAEFVDVFCDEGAFTIDETRRILLSAKELGFCLKVHADEIKWTGATELACELGAVSCDHLIKVSEQGIRALAESETTAVLLPATSVFLGECPGAPGRALIDAGAAVALGTDFNPGTSTAMSMPLCMTLACSMLRLTPEEAFTAATWNAAWASGLGGKAGGLSPGFQADAVVFEAEDYREIAYRFGTSLVDTVVKAGKIVVSGGRIVKGA
ncbi:MAG TPA: imidazolonepropionase [Firmicutes bacterium]|nr:imidazolonepropionase [Candidatus Fermentithermobacillaceae bacterium]